MTKPVCKACLEKQAKEKEKAAAQKPKAQPQIPPPVPATVEVQVVVPVKVAVVEPVKAPVLEPVKAPILEPVDAPVLPPVLPQVLPQVVPELLPQLVPQVVTPIVVPKVVLPAAPVQQQQPVLRLAPPPVAVKGKDKTAEDLHQDGRLLVHMIPGLPGEGKKCWEYDLGQIITDQGYEVCSLSLLWPGKRIYGTRYGLFAAVAEEEILVMGVNDLGVNKVKKQCRGQKMSLEDIRKAVSDAAKRTHENELCTTYADYAKKAKEVASRTPNNEVAANVKVKHLVGICVNQTTVYVNRTKRDKEKETVNAEVLQVSQCIFDLTGLRLPAWEYNENTNTLTALNL
jgi:hypothetical protein